MFKRNDLKVKILFGVCIVLMLVTLWSYKQLEKNNNVSNYYLSLYGESENWEVKSYQLKFTPKELSAGNGTLRIKKTLNGNTDYLSIHVYAVLDNVKEAIQIKIIDGPGTDLRQIPTGSIKGETFYNKNGKPITISDINDVYIVVEWQDEAKGIRMKETIDLYNQESLLD